MPTNVNVNELSSSQASSQDRPSLKDRLAGGGTAAVIAVLTAIGLVFLLVNAIYLNSLPGGSVELGKDAGFFVGP